MNHQKKPIRGQAKTPLGAVSQVYRQLSGASLDVIFFFIEPSAALLHHVGHKFQEVFQMKHGGYGDLSAAKISEMMKANSLDVSFKLLFYCNLILHLGQIQDLYYE